MSPADLKHFTPVGRDQLERVLRARARPAVVKPPVQPELQLEPWAPSAPVIATPAFSALDFVLPYPPSVNTLVRARAMQVHGRWMAQVYKTADHRKYLEAVGVIVGDLVPTAELLAVTLKLYRPRRVGDLDGPIKALFDSLNGRAWLDDSQVVELHVTRHDDKHRPRVEVSIHVPPPQE